METEMSSIGSGQEPQQPEQGNVNDQQYSDFLAQFEGAFHSIQPPQPLFTTEGADLWEIYLATLPQEEMQFHNCHACREFIRTYGGLVTINDDGTTSRAFWHANLDLYRPAFAAMAREVESRRVTGVFLSGAAQWGRPTTGPWCHLAIKAPPRFRSLVQTAEQAMAEKLKDYQTVCRALGEFSRETVLAAVNILRSDEMFRAEKVLAPAEWFLNLYDLRAAAGRNRRKVENVTWLAVAKAPTGFCHPRSSMAGTVFDDVAAGLPTDAIARRFREKMHPLQYLRPQALPTAGNIKRAEEIVAKLGIANALRRRFARVEELETIWRPRAEQQAPPAPGGVFSHLRTRDAAAPMPMSRAPRSTMTWEKFARTTLPEAVKIEIMVPPHGNFGAFATAVDPEAAPIMRWDRADRRNPFSWWVYTGGSRASRWGLCGGAWLNVPAIVVYPGRWAGGLDNTVDGKMFVIEGMRHLGPCAGLAIFPECLRAELHEIRQSIEAFSKAGQMEGAEDGSACGLIFGTRSPVTIRVMRADGTVSEIHLDRMD